MGCGGKTNHGNSLRYDPLSTPRAVAICHENPDKSRSNTAHEAGQFDLSQGGRGQIDLMHHTCGRNAHDQQSSAPLAATGAGANCRREVEQIVEMIVQDVAHDSQIHGRIAVNQHIAEPRHAAQPRR